jgi:hypothetical protein
MILLEAKTRATVLNCLIRICLHLKGRRSHSQRRSLSSEKKITRFLEFRDSLRLRYRLTPTALPTSCDGCTKKFPVEHAMSCKAGGLVLLRHNDVAGEWHRLCAQALTPAAVSGEPLIHSGRDMQTSADGPDAWRHCRKSEATLPPMASGAAERRRSSMFGSPTPMRRRTAAGNPQRSWRHTKKRRRTSTSRTVWRGVVTSPH